MIGPSGIEKKATGQTRPITSADLLKHPEFADALNIERPDTNDRPSKKQRTEETPQDIPLPEPDTQDEIDDILRGIDGGTQPFDNSLGSNNSTTLDDMEIDEGGPPEAMAAARARGGGPGPNPVSKETPITLATPSYGLQETHTTILPFNFWFSAVGANFAGDLKMQIRTNSIDDIVVTQLSTIAQDTDWTRGLFNVPFNNSTKRAATAAGPATFPRTLATGANTTEKPFWVSYWKKLYQYYTVLGCEYKITIRAPQNVVGNSGLLVCLDQDSYSNTAGSTGNVTPDVTLAEFLAFRNVKKYRVVGENTTGQIQQTGIQVISGVIKPGQVKRNISNDGDVKTWTATDGTLPTLKELLNIRFYRDGLDHGDMTSMGSQPGANVQVELKYLVQFKDLQEAARYPYTTNAATITNVLPTDVLDSVGA